MPDNINNNDDFSIIIDWLDEYHASSNSKKKNKFKTLVVMHMIPVVKRIAKTIARRATDPIEDLVQAGYIGLLKAIENFDKTKNDNFRVYAGYLIIGEMKHFLRDKLNTIRVPRHIQELSIRIYNFTKTLTYEELQVLTNDDLASVFDVSTNSVDFAMQIERRRSTLSLEEIYKVDEGSLNYEELLAEKDFEQKLEYEDIRILFDDIIEKLPAEEKVLIDMYYKQDMNQKQIAEALVLSQMALSRRMKKAFRLLGELIKEKESEENTLDEYKD